MDGYDWTRGPDRREQPTYTDHEHRFGGVSYQERMPDAIGVEEGLLVARQNCTAKRGCEAFERSTYAPRSLIDLNEVHATGDDSRVELDQDVEQYPEWVEDGVDAVEDRIDNGPITSDFCTDLADIGVLAATDETEYRATYTRTDQDIFE